LALESELKSAGQPAEVRALEQKEEVSVEHQRLQEELEALM
jgi:hypothetical protein